jgi:hypothetical protein
VQDYDLKLKNISDNYERKFDEMTRMIANLQNLQLMASNVDHHMWPLHHLPNLRVPFGYPYLP